MKRSDAERLSIIKGTPYRINDNILLSDFKWVIAQADKAKRYEEALNKIATRKMSTYLSTSAMNQDFIKTAIEALEEGE